MKKLLVATLSFVSAVAMADDKENAAPKLFDGRPAVALLAIDANAKPPRVLPNTKSTKISIRKKHQLCWMTINVPVKEKVFVAEAFYTPARMDFTSQNSQVTSSEDGKSHLLTTTEESINNEYVSRCWVFDKKDPLGVYQLEVQVNDQVFRGLRFEVVK